MTQIKTQKTIEVVTGLICDRCNHMDDKGLNTFHINHQFGFGSELDCTEVSFSLCDLCLAEVILDKIPNAKFTCDGKRVKVSKTEDGFLIK